MEVADPQPLLLPALLLLSLLAAGWWLLVRPHRQRRLRAQLQSGPLPEDWADIVRCRVPIMARLPAPMRERLDGHVRVFLAEKAFVGCQGMTVNDTVRVTIAAQACLLLLGQDGGEVFPRLHRVLVYPGPFIVPRRRVLPGGVVSEGREALAGESWAEGQVVLAWSEVEAGAADPDDGRNVVLHEFAHQVDQDSGAADGQPWRADASVAQRFAAVMAAARDQACGGDDAGLFDDHARSDAAEFFAAATEQFFERPQALQAGAPAVADELARLYGVDPRAW